MPRKPTTYPSIRAAIEARAKSEGIGPSEIARRLPAGVATRSALQKYLSGDSDLSGRRLDALLALFGLAVVDAAKK
jgi:hypothetical protein